MSRHRPSQPDLGAPSVEGLLCRRPPVHFLSKAAPVTGHPWESLCAKAGRWLTGTTSAAPLMPARSFCWLQVARSPVNDGTRHGACPWAGRIQGSIPPAESQKYGRSNLIDGFPFFFPEPRLPTADEMHNSCVSRVIGHETMDPGCDECAGQGLAEAGQTTFLSAAFPTQCQPSGLVDIASDQQRSCFGAGQYLGQRCDTQPVGGSQHSQVKLGPVSICAASCFWPRHCNMSTLRLWWWLQMWCECRPEASFLVPRPKLACAWLAR